jgi:hypothetical protein
MKYYTITLRGKTSLAHYHTYAENAEAAQTEAIKEQASFGNTNAEILNTLEQGFDIGDRVVVSDHPIIDDEPGTVIGYEEDGWIVVEWKQFDYIEEFHWTELGKVIE